MYYNLQFSTTSHKMLKPKRKCDGNKDKCRYHTTKSKNTTTVYLVSQLKMESFLKTSRSYFIMHVHSKTFIMWIRAM